MATGRTTRRTRRRQISLAVPGAVLVSLLVGQHPSSAAPRTLPEVQFDSSTYTRSETGGVVQVRITRTGSKGKASVRVRTIDSDGLTDGDEFADASDPMIPDTDADGLSDGDEVHLYGTDPGSPDTDGDTVPDGVEVAEGSDPLVAPDADGDGLSDVAEANRGTDANNPDTGGDALSDGDEVHVYSTDPLNPDTDADGVSDGEEVAAGTDPLAS